MSLNDKLRNYFAAGFEGTNDMLAARFGTSREAIRGAIRQLRLQGMPIGKTLYETDMIARYHLAGDFQLPRLGRPPHRLAVSR